MRPSYPPYDLTASVRLDSAKAVGEAVRDILDDGFAADAKTPLFLKRAFTDVAAAFWGQDPAYLPCDTPYHDLRHSLDTALLTARLLDGYQKSVSDPARKLSRDEAEFGVFLALYHDTGFLREPHEGHLNGAQLTRDHENRSVKYVRRYLAKSERQADTDLAELIHATNFSHAPAKVVEGHAIQQAAIAQALGSADLISQVADRYYLERCRDFLFGEFHIAGVDRMADAQGQETVLYKDGLDLLKKTPAFYQHVVSKRLVQDFENAYHWLDKHFAGNNPFPAAMQANLDYLQALIAENRLETGLRRQPKAMLPESAA